MLCPENIGGVTRCYLLVPWHSLHQLCSKRCIWSVRHAPARRHGCCCYCCCCASKRFIGKALDERFTPDDFKTEVFLGTGSFGRVTLVTFKDK